MVQIALAFAVLLRLAGTPISQDDALSAAMAFLTAGAKGATQSFQGPAPDLTVVRQLSTGLVVPDDHWEVDFKEGVVLVEKATGRISIAFTFPFCQDDETFDLGAAFSQAQALALAQSWYEAAGFAGQLSVTSYGMDIDDTGRFHIASASVSPTFGGVPYHLLHQSWVEFGYRSGRLNHVHFREAPTPPADVVATVTPQQAEDTVVGYIMQNMAPPSLVLDDAPFKCLWRPSTAYLIDRVDDYMTPGQKALGEANQSMLVYSVAGTWWAYVNGEPAYRLRQYEGIVDAKTGALLLANEVGLHYMGAGEKPVPFGWDLTPGPTSVLGAASVAVPRGDVSRTFPKAPPTKGVKLILRRCRVCIPVEFDAKSGLLWTGKGKLRSYGMPNAPLLKALKAAKPARNVWPKPNKAQ